MANKMLIDATHPEETRVVVTRGNRVEEFDYESASRKQLRGNIYLAKVARIEPSLQAAFVNYGGNRHGFLAFAEIHQDYYQIPLAVREAIMKEEALDRVNSGREFSNGQPKPEAFAPETGPEDTVGPNVNQSEKPDIGNEGSRSGVGADAARHSPAEDSADAHGPEAEAQPDGRGHETSIPLQAVLPPVLYEEFSAAIARAQEAADEIPSHPNDVEGVRDASGSDIKSGDGDPSDELSQDSPSQDRPSHAGSASAARSDDDEPPVWDSQDASGASHIVTVADAGVPAPVEVIGAEDALEELPQRAKRRWRHYKIQEVIKRNQIVLIQVVKEERGTKGAALTTYLSLAGRYTVLMPNTASGGGISRKITVPADRKRLKEIAQELEVPEGMGLIIRTAGASRTKAEIKRDFEYLLRLWETVRDLTLKSTAPCLVYEESDLIKRSIRDLYNKEIDEILVAGESAFREAREFMRMLMPSHAKNVVLYREPEPLFTRYEVERQLNQMFSPVVTLKSGGYIVLNQTEALVAIDVNSGRSTREFSIESTALNTNLEASDEIARQVRLRDLAGLIVIDYIDMDERRNNRSVERRLKEALRFDRARIQVGSISHFGLMEMSRQRLRQGVVEVSTMPCPICQGVGHIRSTESVGLMILRSVEDHLRTQGSANLTVNVAPDAALYILNHKRAYLLDIEVRYGVSIVVAADEKARGAHFAIERGADATPPPVVRVLEAPKGIHVEPILPVATDDDEEDDNEKEAIPGVEGEDANASRRRRRRRRGGRGESRDGQPSNGAASPAAERRNGAHISQIANPEAAAGIGPMQPHVVDFAASQGGVPQVDVREGQAVRGDLSAIAAGTESEMDTEDSLKRNRRRGRRGGRRHRGLEANGEAGNINGVPGLGEQPSVPFDHDFPINKVNVAVVVRPPDVMPQASAQMSRFEALDGPVLPQVAAPFVPQPVLSPEGSVAILPPAEVVNLPASTGPTIEAVTPHSRDDMPAKTASESEVTSTALVEPKPRPVRAGPTRKGWWQRRIG